VRSFNKRIQTSPTVLGIQFTWCHCSGRLRQAFFFRAYYITFGLHCPSYETYLQPQKAYRHFFADVEHCSFQLHTQARSNRRATLGIVDFAALNIARRFAMHRPRG